MKKVQKLTLKVLETSDTARRLSVTVHNSHNRVLQTPNYLVSTRGGALNGVIKHNLRDSTFD
jgi:hypothetical protein